MFLGVFAFFIRNDLNSISIEIFASLFFLAAMLLCVFLHRRFLLQINLAEAVFKAWSLDFIFRTLFIFFLVSLIYFGVIFLFLKPIDNFEYTRKSAAWLYLALPSAWVLFGQYSVLFRLMKDEAGIYDFYKKLSIQRRKPENLDLRETYSHLREHSNAVFIVAVEVSLFSLLIFLFDLSSVRLKAPATGGHVYQILLYILVVWILPSIFMWSTANRLEKALADGKFSESLIIKKP
ncbi:hypothetical protein [Paracidovorax citrulli]|uniref:Uncharacterized protein n=1 Tax=Paracidovorax citrulli TaxID=80869 RepID=A0ABY9AVS1_PARCI|nr:hypothetical protein [Paracidovorax citrulli]PVY67319.1 hypothetical protein C8E08_4760 [Paracidovorax citrulli]QCX09040.1 hypothetical protein APS58_0053 [Paracidovorax citrulli]REG68522.1 hypothetical protein C8E07_1632 [Paracidovorax citrulli]RLJ93079.1 hypothetical protein C8E06_1632 [Paracidovorax citrulli]UEG48246.1 hypothetical protein LKW27_10490 [Paracidovorax citrulli]